MRRLYCRLCAHAHDSIGGDQPTECPGCDKPALWTTEPVPKVRWELSADDRRFMRVNRIAVNNDHEDDAA